MSSDRPTLVVHGDEVPLTAEALAALRSAFEITDGDDAGSAMHLVASAAGAGPSELLEALGDGAAVWDRTGVPDFSGTDDTDPQDDDVDSLPGIRWSSARFAALPAELRATFARTCRVACIGFDRAIADGEPPAVRAFTITVDECYHEIVVTPFRRDADGRVRSVTGILWETTAARRAERKIEEIDAAGAQLLRLDSHAVASLNMRERLERLEARITQGVQEVLDFDDFEIRLIDRESNQLELVMNKGLSPLKIGEVIRAEEAGNGICGWVAATGRPYLCTDARRDVLYHDGLDEAGSSVTVPLRLDDDSVIGVFNVESHRTDAFTEDDVRFAELFGRYIAMAMHILDLLVVERYTTNEQISENVVTELGRPLDAICDRAESIRGKLNGEAIGEEMDALIDAVRSVRRRLAEGITGPRTIIGAEQAMAEGIERDPVLADKRVLLADNEAVVRDAIRDLLVRHGCDVTACDGGAPTIVQLERMAAGEASYDVVISDIRMPDRNGYEVFRAAREVSRELPVLLMTGFGYDPHHSIVRASQEGLDGFLFKPLKASQLIEALQKAVAARA